jgi:hypothetical protein
MELITHDNAHDLACDLKSEDTHNWLEDNGMSQNTVEMHGPCLRAVTPLDGY